MNPWEEIMPFMPSESEILEGPSQFLNGLSDLDWITTTHCKAQAGKGYRSIVLYGNEDHPKKVEFFLSRMPHYQDKPDETVIFE